MNESTDKLINKVKESTKKLLQTYKQLENEPNLVEKYDIAGFTYHENESGEPCVTEIKQHPNFGYILVWRKSPIYMEKNKNNFHEVENNDIALIQHVSNFMYYEEVNFYTTINHIKSSIEYYEDGYTIERMWNRGEMIIVEYIDNIAKRLTIYDIFNNYSKETNIYNLKLPSFIQKINNSMRSRINKKSKEFR